MTMTSPAPTALDPHCDLDLGSLRARVHGPVSVPGDDTYPETVATWDLAAHSHPPVALRAACTDDIAAGARWAAEQGLGVAIRSTGHGARSDDHDTLVISTGALRDVAVDPDGRWAVAGPGARWSDVSNAAAPLGLVGLEGASAGVGVVGYTLGGGAGPVGRTFGFAADRVSRIDVLDADYRPVTVEADDTDAFWAMRGAGSLALVTGIEFELVRLPELFGGGVYLDGRDAEAVLAAYAAMTEAVDDRTTTSIALVRLPPVPQLPEVLRGRFVVHIRIAHVDPVARDLAADGRRILAPVLSAGRVLIDATRIMEPADLPDIHRDPVAPLSPAYRGALLDDLAPSTIGALAGSIGDGYGPSLVEVRHLGGAYTTQPSQPNCVTGRDAAFNLYVSAPVDPRDPASARRTVDDVVASATPSSRAQFNFGGPAPRPGEVLALWDDADAARILGVQRRFDPENRIRTGRPLR
jgi:hypothetical protein